MECDLCVTKFVILNRNCLSYYMTFSLEELTDFLTVCGGSLFFLFFGGNMRTGIVLCIIREGDYDKIFNACCHDGRS